MRLVGGKVVMDSDAGSMAPPSLPPVPLTGDQGQKRFNDSVREAIEQLTVGEKRAVTVMDVENFFPTTTDTRIPPAPSGLQASGAFRNVILTWDYPDYDYHAATRIYRANVDDFTQAAVLANPSAKIYADPTGPGQTFFYWITNVSQSGRESAPNGVAGTVGATAPDVDFLLDLLEGQILESALTETLQERIDLIDAPDTVAGSVAARVLTEANARIQAITDEALARSNADNAVAGDLQTFAAQVRGTYEGTDLTQVTTGLIAQERNARVTQGSALAESISLLTAGVAGGFDPFKTWYFDGTAEGWTGSAATIGYASGNITVDSTGASPALFLAADLNPGVTGGQYNVVKARVKRTAGTGWTGKLRWKTSGHAFSASYELATLTPAPDVGEWTVLEWNVQDTADWTANTILNVQLLLGADAADDFAIDWISVGRNGPGASVASLLAEQNARATADTAEITARETLTTKLLGTTNLTGLTLASLASGLIYDERTARTTADGNEVTARQVLSSKMFGTNDPSGITNLGQLTSGLLFDEKTARTTAVSAEASSRAALSAVVNTKGAAFWQDNPPTPTGPNDVWFDTNDGNKTYRPNGAGGWVAAPDARIEQNRADIVSEAQTRADAVSAVAGTVTTLTSTVNGNDSAVRGLIQSEATTRANGDGAITTRIDTLQSSYNGQIASIQQTASTQANAITGLQAQYTIKLDVGGRISGFGLASSNNSSEFSILADRFSVVHPGSNGGAPIVPFVIVNGQTYIRSAMIADAAIGRAKIADAAIDDAKIANLSAAKVTFGEMSGDRIGVNSLNANRITTDSLAARIATIGTAFITNAHIENLTIGGEKFQRNAVSNCAYMQVGYGGSGSSYAAGVWTDFDTAISGGSGTGSGGGTGGSGGGSGGIYNNEVLQ